ncbi:MAG: alpha/beta hydrolase [Hyphomonadaceae bacterium]|nr:alpha/beta hydrolase [Hyphomonadaceae bacterium]
MISIRNLAIGAAIALATSCATTPAEPVHFSGADCMRPPVLHCPDADCPGTTVTNGGPVVEPKTGRTYFLDYPCDLKPGEKVTVVLSLHGGGSYGNWQRHYFPILDQVDKHRLVVATPYSPTRFWAPSDDVYLQNITSSVIEQIGAKNIKSFWLAGHSFGGMTSNRIVCTDFFKDKVDGWLSLSGGRIGAAPLAANFGPTPAAAPPASTPAPAAPAPAAPAAAAPSFPPIDGANGSEPAKQGAAVTPKCDISYIFTTGEHEIAALPEKSPWADKYQCGPRRRTGEIVDAKAGYVYSSSSPNSTSKSWGLKPRPGTAEVMVYPGCKGGKLVADVVRKDKGHTEGLEPNVTEELVRMMLSAPGGKLRKS